MSWWNPFTWGQKVIPTGALDDADIRAIRIVRAYLNGQIDALNTQLTTLGNIEGAGDKETAEQFAIILKGQAQGFENSPGLINDLKKHDTSAIQGTVLERLLSVEKKKAR